jgi:predicted metal-binding transcription factor (methanogenesis marker protein 9)
MSKMGLKKTQLSKDQYVSLVKKLTDDDLNPNIDRIERIREATITSKKSSKAIHLRQDN